MENTCHKDSQYQQHLRKLDHLLMQLATKCDSTFNKEESKDIQLLIAQLRQNIQTQNNRIRQNQITNRK